MKVSYFVVFYLFCCGFFLYLWDILFGYEFFILLLVFCFLVVFLFCSKLFTNFFFCIKFFISLWVFFFWREISILLWVLCFVGTVLKHRNYLIKPLLWLFKTTTYFCFSFCLFNSYQSLHMWLDDIWRYKSVYDQTNTEKDNSFRKGDSRQTLSQSSEYFREVL